MRDALDFSFSTPDPAEVAALGYDLLGYTGNARPDRGFLDRCAQHGVGFTFVQETTSDRSQEGTQAGVLDAQFAESRADAVGYGDRTIWYVVSDGNRRDPNSGADAIAGYGEGIARTATRPFGFYGNRYAVDAAVSGAKRVPGARLVAGPQGDGGWVPETWDADPARDALIQRVGGTPIDGTDLNSVLHDYTGQTVPPTPTPDEDDDMKGQFFHLPDSFETWEINPEHGTKIKMDSVDSINTMAFLGWTNVGNAECSQAFLDLWPEEKK